MNNPYFVLTTDRETADAIEGFTKSATLNMHRTFRVVSFDHHTGFSNIKIEATTPTGIEPKDLFWLGWYSKMISQNKNHTS